jgi:NAD(P)-dependent dehydrogenase (short-subunit alcohol dehydrogenase family)
MKGCIITGASKGIGRAVAVRMSREADVGPIALVARSEQGLRETAALMAGDRAVLLPCDLGDLSAIPDLVGQAQRALGGIGMLLNIAGYTEPASLMDITDENISRTFTVNVFAALAMARECVRYMRADGGKILNVASTAGTTPRPGWLTYAASKAAVISLSQTLSEELSEYNIQVYCLSPGRCATDMRHRLAPEEDPAQIMQPERVAEIIATLMRDGANCLDGQNIIVRQRT